MALRMHSRAGDAPLAWMQRFDPRCPRDDVAERIRVRRETTTCDINAEDAFLGLTSSTRAAHHRRHRAPAAKPTAAQKPPQQTHRRAADVRADTRRDMRRAHDTHVARLLQQEVNLPEEQRGGLRRSLEVVARSDAKVSRRQRLIDEAAEEARLQQRNSRAEQHRLRVIGEAGGAERPAHRLQRGVTDPHAGGTPQPRFLERKYRPGDAPTVREEAAFARHCAPGVRAPPVIAVASASASASASAFETEPQAAAAAAIAVQQPRPMRARARTQVRVKDGRRMLEEDPPTTGAHDSEMPVVARAPRRGIALGGAPLLSASLLSVDADAGAGAGAGADADADAEAVPAITRVAQAQAQPARHRRPQAEPVASQYATSLRMLAQPRPVQARHAQTQVHAQAQAKRGVRVDAEVNVDRAPLRVSAVVTSATRRPPSQRRHAPVVEFEAPPAPSEPVTKPGVVGRARGGGVVSMRQRTEPVPRASELLNTMPRRAAPHSSSARPPPRSQATHAELPVVGSNDDSHVSRFGAARRPPHAGSRAAPLLAWAASVQDRQQGAALAPRPSVHHQPPTTRLGARGAHSGADASNAAAEGARLQPHRRAETRTHSVGRGPRHAGMGAGADAGSVHVAPALNTGSRIRARPAPAVDGRARATQFALDAAQQPLMAASGGHDTGGAARRHSAVHSGGTRAVAVSDAPEIGNGGESGTQQRQQTRPRPRPQQSVRAVVRRAPSVAVNTTGTDGDGDGDGDRMRAASRVQTHARGAHLLPARAAFATLDAAPSTVAVAATTATVDVLRAATASHGRPRARHHHTSLATHGVSEDAVAATTVVEDEDAMRGVRGLVRASTTRMQHAAPPSATVAPVLQRVDVHQDKAAVDSAARLASGHARKAPGGARITRRETGARDAPLPAPLVHEEARAVRSRVATAHGLSNIAHRDTQLRRHVRRTSRMSRQDAEERRQLVEAHAATERARVPEVYLPSYH